jgi:hypothetical protein
MVRSFLVFAGLVAALLCGCGGGGGDSSGASSPGAGTPGPTAPPPAPVFSSGKWSPPEAVGNSIGYGNSVAIDNVGTSAVVLTDLSLLGHIALKVLRKALHAPWGGEEALTPLVAVQSPETRRFGGVQVQVDDAGNTFAAWTFRDLENVDSHSIISTVSVRRRAAATGVWSATVLLQNDPSAFASGVHVAVDADGTAWAVWTQRTFKAPLIPPNDRYRIFARKFTPAAAAWGAAEPVSPEFTGDYLGPGTLAARVSTDKRGNPRVLIAHENFVSGEHTLYFTSRAGGTWAAPTELVRAPPAGGLAFHLSDYDLAVDRDDNAIAMWRQHDGTRHVILARRFTIGTGWGPTTLLMVPSRDNGHSPRLAMDTQGNAFVLWHEFDGAVSFAIWAARFTKASGGWDQLDIISSEANRFGDDSTDPRIGFDGAGNAVAVWQKFDSRLNRIIVRTNYNDARTGWSTDETISGTGVAFTLELAVSATGFATATWWKGENNLFTPQSATRVP